MNTRTVIFRSATLSLLVLAATFNMSCMTTYDAYGRPVQSVDPALAVAGVAAAGLVGYAIANDNNHHGNHYYRGHGGYNRGYYGPYRRY